MGAEERSARRHPPCDAWSLCLASRGRALGAAGAFGVAWTGREEADCEDARGLLCLLGHLSCVQCLLNLRQEGAGARREKRSDKPAQGNEAVQGGRRLTRRTWWGRNRRYMLSFAVICTSGAGLLVPWAVLAVLTTG